MHKKIITILLFVLALTLCGGTIYFISNRNNSEDQTKESQEVNQELNEDIHNNESSSEPVEEENITYSNLKNITQAEFTTLIKNKESFILLASQTFCPGCKGFKPILNETLKEHNLTAYVIEYDLLTSSERETMDSLITVTSTPTTIFIQKGIEAKDYRIDINDIKEIEEYK